MNQDRFLSSFQVAWLGEIPATAGLAVSDWLSGRHIAQFSALIGWPGPAGAGLGLTEIWPAGAGQVS